MSLSALKEILASIRMDNELKCFLNEFDETLCHQAQSSELNLSHQHLPAQRKISIRVWVIRDKSEELMVNAKRGKI